MMATPEEIQDVLDDLPDNASDYGWDEQRINDELDSGVAGDALFLKFWRKVSTATVGLVDMSESGSSRSLSQLHKQAADMAKMYQERIDKEEEPIPVTSGIRSRPIRRV
jgi:hypothetical protein